MQNVAVLDELNVYDNIDYFCGLYIKDKETRNILGNLIANDDLKFSDLIYSIKEKENVRTLNGLKRK